MSQPFEDAGIDADLIGRLLDEHGAGLALYASQWTAAAEDCVQEALVELARQPTTPQHVLAWLYRVVKHRALNEARASRRRRERETRSIAERLVVPQLRGASDQSDTIAFVEVLDQLEASQREVVVMRIWGGLTFDEIGNAKSISTSSAHRQYERALEKLRVLLDVPCSTSEKKANSN